MQSHPLRTSVIGSYPFPSWLEFASRHLAEFGRAEREKWGTLIKAAGIRAD